MYFTMYYCPQLFRASILLVEDLLLMGPTPSSFYLFVEALSGFLRKTQIKADTKLTVSECCQKFDRRSSGNFWQRSAPQQYYIQVKEF